MNLTISKYHENEEVDFFSNLSRLNFLFGKNGCGKSRILRELQTLLQSQANKYISRYIIPQRGGVLRSDEKSDKNKTLKKDQSTNFKEQTVSRFKDLKLRVLERIEDPEDLRNTKITFQAYLNKVNSLLENIEIKSSSNVFKIVSKDSPYGEIPPDQISSGEAELITLAIEILCFAEENIKSEKTKILILDAADVYLDPESQAKLSNFTCNLALEENFYVIMASHSKYALAEINDTSNIHVAFMEKEDNQIQFNEVPDSVKTPE